MTHNHSDTRELIQRYFILGLSSAKRKRMAGAIDGCADCRAHFERMSTFESLLCGDGEKISPFALERQEAAILARFQTVVQKWRMPIIGVFAAVAALLLMLVALWPSSAPNQFPAAVALGDDVTWSELRPKSAGVSENHQVGIRVFKVNETPRSVAPEHVLTSSDMITFTYSAMDKRYRYLTLMGIQDARTFFYYPHSASRSIAIADNVVDAPLGDGFRLKNHHPGALRIVGLFSDAPITVTAIEKQLGQNSKNLMQPSPLRVQLQGVSVVEHSIWIEIEK